MSDLLKKRYLTNALARSYLKYMKKKPLILVDLGATNCRATIRDYRGEKVLRGLINSKYQTKIKKSKKSVIEAIQKVTERYREILENPTIKIAVPGIVKDEVTLPNLNIENWDMKKALQTKLKTKDITLVNDVQAAWKGEQTQGVVIYVGSGIGASDKGKNIEIGRSITYPNYKYMGYSKNPNIIENFASGHALKKIGESKGLKIDATKSEYAYKLSLSKDEKAKEILKEAGTILGKAILTYHKIKRYKKDKEYIIGGSLGTNKHYFEGIKNSNNLNIRKTKYKGSEAIYRGLI
ncbi:MAG: ROK family protein [Candidatus Woesearchaeota archaeon]